MNFRHLNAIIAIVAGCMFAGCHSDIDMNNIDTQSEIEMGLALPVGSIHATLGDFLGNGKVPSLFIDSVNNKGVITWKDTFKIARNFHQIDLSQYISKKKLNLNVYEKLEAAHMIGPNGKVTGTGMPYTMTFDMPLKLTGINSAENLNNERLDSALIDKASFSSIIRRNNLPLEWEWIDQVTLKLGDQLHRPAGDIMVVYDKNRDHYGYNQNIPTEVDHFTINLMKKNAAGQYVVGEVVDSCDFKINFTFTVPAGQEVEIPENAGFDYELGVQFIEYQAIWGKFQRSNDMYNEEVVDLSESWGSLNFISDWKVPFADPKIDMYIYTKIAGAMKVDGDYLYALDASGNRHEASFKYGNTTRKDFHKQFQVGEYLDPDTSIIGDSTTNMMIPFDKDPERGHIAESFVNLPQKLGYKFGIDFNYQMTPQIRITPNTSVRIEAACQLPFIFKNGVFVDYKDTIRDLNLSQYSIDSLLAEVKEVDTLKATDVALYIRALNTIPLDVKASMRCLDEFGNVIMDPDTATKPLLLFPADTITLKAPEFKTEGGNWSMKEPGETIITANLNKRQLDLMPKIKSIVYTAIVDDKSLQDAYSKGMNNVKITADEGLTIKLGLTAHVDAILNLSGNKKQ